MSSRWVAVDDTSSSIKYSGPWTLDSGQNWQGGNFGAPYLNSLHNLKGGQGSFSYTFDGSQGAVFGTNNIKTTDGVQDPSWTCEVDGTTLPLPSSFAYMENNWILCTWSNIGAGKHTLTVTVTSSSQAFLFDKFQYIPSSTADVTNADLLLDQNDAALQYGSGWQNLGTIAKMAPAGGAVVTLPFYGTGIRWFGTAPTEMPHGATTATYTIDGGSATTFDVPGVVNSVTTQYFQLIFEKDSLPLGHHTLQVTSQGTSSLTPLVLANIVIEGGSVQEPAASTPIVTSADPSKVTVTDSGSSTIITTTTTGSGTSQTTTTTASGTNTNARNTSGSVDPSGSTTSTGTTENAATTSGTPSGSVSAIDGGKHSSPIGAIVGGVVGGLLLIIFLILLFFCLRRKRRKEELHRLAVEAQPFNRDQSPRESYSTPAPGSTFSPASGAPLESASGVYGTQQMAQTGTSYAYVSGKNSSYAVNNLRSGAPGFPSPSPVTSFSHNHNPSTSYSPSSDQSEAGGSSAVESAAPLLSPNRSVSSGNSSAAGSSTKYEEHLPYMDSPTSVADARTGAQQKVINHQDSGFRLPRPQMAPEEVIEYPPEYTAS
ncbi:hypothetical protein BDN70DRAFT_871263 [Pholiota conissans]|uniref:Uncharacterized protein n=1 Tax=Pholiota conissans TaxID=109636 RepID=A0A9P5ZEC9_9AGAR|nr:hypothetical protein BDN70DRAFT_871263 [Pholiota conissans]